MTREPGGTPLAERVRQIVLDRGDEQHDAAGGDPADVRGAQRPSRQSDPTRTGARRLGRVRSLHGCDSRVSGWRPRRESRSGSSSSPTKFTATSSPHCTLLLDCPWQVGLDRAKVRAGDAAADRFESEREPFFERVRVDLPRARTCRAGTHPHHRCAVPLAEVAEAGRRRARNIALWAGLSDRDDSGLARARDGFSGRGARGWPHASRTADPRVAGRRAATGSRRGSRAWCCAPDPGLPRADVCASCRRALADSIPTSLSVHPIEDSQQLRIEQVRELAAELALTSHQGGYKVGIDLARRFTQSLRSQRVAQDAGGAFAAYAADPGRERAFAPAGHDSQPLSAH